MRLSKKVALITGGARGLGADIARRFQKEGAVVFIGDVNREEGEKLALEIGSAFLSLDVTSEEGWKAAIAAVLAKAGRLDILVNNAGITVDKTVLKMELTDWHKVLRTNLSSCFYVCHAVLPHMIKRQYGRIVNISSVTGLAGNFGQANYAAAKAGLFGFTKTLALETARKGITVNAIAPGFVKTEMTDKIPAEVLERILDQIPMRRLGDPYEISRVVVFLAQEESGYITGQIYGINGGLYM
jgi:NAD(P)-dependent dehydrogenase (short-subunit alcohol dehydrogenase family)